VIDRRIVGHAAAASVAAAAVFAAILPWVVLYHQETTGSGGFYTAMARHPGTFTTGPEGFRILTPWLVSLLPGSIEHGFMAVTILCLALSAGLLFVLVALLMGIRNAWWGVALFAVSGPVVGGLRDPFLVDPLGYVFVLSALILLYFRRWFALALVMGAAVFEKESTLVVLLPAAIVAATDRPRQLLRFAPVLLLPVAGFIAIHMTPLIWEHRGHHSWIEDIPGMWRYQRDEVGLYRAPLQAVLYSLGPMWAIAFLGLRRAHPFLRLCTPFVPLMVASCIAAADWPRIIGWCFPIVIALVLAAPLTQAARAVLAGAVFVDAAVSQALATSAGKEAFLLLVFVLGAASPWLLGERAELGVVRKLRGLR